MTLTEFKDRLYEVRSSKKNEFALIRDLDNLTEELCEKLNCSVIDYSKDRVQATRDYDGKTINAITLMEEKRERILAQLKEIQEENSELENAIFSFNSLEGTLLRYYFLESQSIKAISKRIGYSEQYTWELWRKAIKDLYEKEENR